MDREAAAYNYLRGKLKALSKKVCTLEEGGTGGGGSSNASDLTSGTLSDQRLSTNVVLKDLAQTLTNKTLDGASNTFTNIPYSSLTGVPNTDLSNYVDRTTAQIVAGNKTFSNTASFTDTYANGQATFGGINAAARVIFNNGVNGAASMVIGFTASNGAIPEIRSTATAGLTFTTTNVSAPMWFTTGGSESMRLLANGSLLIGQTVDNGGGKLQITGNSTFAGDILTDANNTRNIGTLANRFAGIYSNTVWSGNFLNSASSFYGTTNVPSQIAFRQGTGTNLIGGFYGTTGNFTLQTSSANLGTDTGERLQVEGTTRLGGATAIVGTLTTQAITADGNGTRDIGSNGVNYRNVFANTVFSGTTAIYGTYNLAAAIQFRQGSSSQLVGGVYPTTGNWTIQTAAATLGTDTGERLQVEGTTKLGGNTSVTGNVTLSGNLQNTGSGTGSIGTSGSKFGVMYSDQFLGVAGTVYLGNASTTQGILFRQGTTSQLPFGIFANGRTFIQTPSALPSDTGEQLQVIGTSRFTGDQTVIGNQSVSGNLTNSGTVILRAGTATAGTSPLKFTSGTLLTTAEVGAQEFLTDDFYGTITTGAARKKFVLADATAGLTSGRVPYATTAGRLLDASTFLFSSTRGGLLSIGTTAATSNLNVGSSVATSGNSVLATFTGAAHTGQTASVELSDVYFNLNRTVQFATGAQSLLRAFRIAAPTYAFVAASTITKAVTFSVSGAPSAGTNATITTPYAFEVETGNTLLGGNLRINTIPALGTATTNVLVSNGGVVSTRTLTELITDIGVSAAPRITSITSSATITPNVDTTDQLNVTALATAATFAAPTGTYSDAFPLMIRITSDASARALTWNAIYRGGTEISLPTTTVASRTIYIQFVYNALANKFDLVGTTGGLS